MTKDSRAFWNSPISTLLKWDYSRMEWLYYGMAGGFEMPYLHKESFMEYGKFACPYKRVVKKDLSTELEKLWSSTVEMTFPNSSRHHDPWWGS